jgi:hypothetical protein
LAFIIHHENEKRENEKRKHEIFEGFLQIFVSPSHGLNGRFNDAVVVVDLSKAHFL